jgi:general secretion pathway protein G
MNKKGFSLMELILVIVIMGVLVGAMLPMFSNNTARAQRAKAESELDSIKSAVLMYRTDTGGWPIAASTTVTTESGLITRGNGNPVPAADVWQGPYIDAWGNDPWGSAYRLISGATGASIEVRTFGANGTQNNNCTAACVCTITDAADDICAVVTPAR